MDIKTFNARIKSGKYSPKSMMILHEHFVKGYTASEIASQYGFEYHDICELMFRFDGNAANEVTHIELTDANFQFAS